MSFLRDVGKEIENSLSPTSGYGDPKSSNPYAMLNNSFSGCDIRAVVHTDGESAVTIGNLQTLTYSIHRERYPVRGLGSTYPRGYTAGPRTLAGTLVFTVFDRYALWNISQSKAKLDGGSGEDAYSLLGDQMVPFDISCIFINEMGHHAQLNIYGVRLVDESQTLSINDIFTESVHSFVAEDIDEMFPSITGPVKSSKRVTSVDKFYTFDSSDR